MNRKTEIEFIKQEMLRLEKSLNRYAQGSNMENNDIISHLNGLNEMVSLVMKNSHRENLLRVTTIK
jgi:hypothetical protein